MIISDLNVLLYAIDTESAFHTRARTWWEDLLNGHGRVGMPWHVALGFVRLSTSERVFRNPLSLGEAWDEVEAWMAMPGVVAVQPGPGHLGRVRDLLAPLGAGGKLVADAHLAALAIEQHATLATNDRDFQRFAGLRTVNPVA
ncbi:MAG: ribonuclease VapC37 [Chthonomonas sp.]